MVTETGRPKGRGRGRRAGKAGSAESTTLLQPSSGPGFLALQQIVNTWDIADGEELYEVTADWQVIKDGPKGQKSYDIHWEEETGLIRWGNQFFFDPVDIENGKKARLIHWYSSKDPDKEAPTHEWHAAQNPGKRKGAEAKKAPERARSAPPAARAPKTPTSAGGPNAVAGDVVVQFPKGVSAPEPGDMFRVVSVSGSRVTLAAAPSPALKPKQKGGKAKAKAKQGGGPPADAPPPLQGTTPTKGPGFHALCQITGVWEGPKKEQYEILEEWKCITTDKKGKENRYKLSWDDEYALVLWGKTYMFDPHDLEGTDGAEIMWFRQTDFEKVKPAFTWNRSPEDM